MSGRESDATSATTKQAHQAGEGGDITVFICNWGGSRELAPKPPVPRGREVELVVASMPKPLKPPRSAR